MNETTSNTESELERITDATGYNASTDDDIMLPDGWVEGADIFDPDSWGTTTTDGGQESTETTEGADEASEAEDNSPTTESEETPADEENSEAKADAADAPKKIHIKAKVDHQEREVDLDEAELPDIYQKAQIVDRLQGKLTKYEDRLANVERLAKIMGYADGEEMLNAAESNYKDAELQRLTDGGLEKSVAEDVLEQKWSKHGSKKAVTKDTDVVSAQPQKRDFNAELQTLYKAHPEAQGNRNILNALTDDVVVKGMTPLEAYEKYQATQAKAETKKLQKENKVLRQNAASAAKAPVKGVTSGGKTDTKKDDDWIAGFDSYNW